MIIEDTPTNAKGYPSCGGISPTGNEALTIGGKRVRSQPVARLIESMALFVYLLDDGTLVILVGDQSLTEAKWWGVTQRWPENDGLALKILQMLALGKYTANILASGVSSRAIVTFTKPKGDGPAIRRTFMLSQLTPHQQSVSQQIWKGLVSAAT